MKHLKHELFFLLYCAEQGVRAAGAACVVLRILVFLSWRSPAAEAELQWKAERHAEPFGHDK